MVRVIFCAWIPRSYLHVYEVGRKAKKTPLIIDALQIRDYVRFNVKDEDFSAEFMLNGDGLYTLASNVKQEQIDDFLIKAENILLHKIIKTSHSVTYQQILSKALPFAKVSVVIGNRGTFYNKQDPYLERTRIFVKAKETKAVTKSALVHAQGLLFGQFLYLMMERMESLYKKANEVSILLEKEGKLDDIKRAVFAMDLVKKNVAESYEKIRQMGTIFEHASKRVEHEKSNTLTRALGTKSLYEMLVSDKEYVEGLWSLLIAFLNNLDAAAEARLSYQETIESRVIEAILGGEVAIAIAIVLVGIFSQNTGSVFGLAAVATIGLSLIVWWVLRKVLNAVNVRIGRVRKLASE